MGLSQEWPQPLNRDHRWKAVKMTMYKRKKIREIYNRPLNTGSTINSELANQPTLRALVTCVAYTKNRWRVVRWSRVMKHEEKI